MARKLRVQYPDAIYHVMNRGDRREFIFKDGSDPGLLLTTRGGLWQKATFQIQNCFSSRTVVTSSWKRPPRINCGHAAVHDHFHSELTEKTK